MKKRIGFFKTAVFGLYFMTSFAAFSENVTDNEIRIKSLEGFVNNNIVWRGHDTFKITVDKKTIYIDPFKLETKENADIILISHEHEDHFSLNDLKKISNKNSIIISTEKVINILKERKNIAYEKLITLKSGDISTFGSITITAVPAYNTNSERLNFHPKESGNIGFIVNTGTETIYFAGDTDKIDEQKGLGADIAMIPVSGTYVMTADEAKDAVLEIKPKIVIPMHYGTIVGSDKDPTRLEELLKDTGIKVIKKKREGK